jgi:predicted PurR-regulated permease PerM
MLSLTGMVTIVVYLIVAGLVFWLLSWLVDYCEVKDPFRKVAKIVLAIMAVLVVIGILLSLVGGTPIFRP